MCRHRIYVAFVFEYNSKGLPQRILSKTSRWLYSPYISCFLQNEVIDFHPSSCLLFVLFAQWFLLFSVFNGCFFRYDLISYQFLWIYISFHLVILISSTSLRSPSTFDTLFLSSHIQGSHQILSPTLLCVIAPYHYFSILFICLLYSAVSFTSGRFASKIQRCCHWCLRCFFLASLHFSFG